MTVIGTRPEIIRLSRVMTKMDEAFNQCIVHTGQNYDYELNKIFFEDMEIRKPDIFLNAAGSTAAATIGRVIERFDSVIVEKEPEALLVLGDTNSSLAAIPAKRRRIPVFHMEAGNRCFDDRVPEEINRRIVDHISDINMPYSDIAREYLLREGLAPDRIIKTGSPMFEVLSYYRQKINQSNILGQLDLLSGRYFVVSCHREENIEDEDNFNGLISIINALSAKYNEPIIFSAHPRTRKKIEQRGVKFDKLVHIMKPFAFSDYIQLERNAKLVLSDSGTITEESSILNFPALNIREVHERPEGMEETSVVMCPLRQNKAMEIIDIILNQQSYTDRKRNFKLVADYNVSNVSSKVIRIMLSYIDYINSRVWKK